MNEKQRLVSDSLVALWGEGRSLVKRFEETLASVNLPDDELLDVAVSAVHRLVPDDDERRDMLINIRETADKLAPGLPFRDVILKALDRAGAPRLSVNQND